MPSWKDRTLPKANALESLPLRIQVTEFKSRNSPPRINELITFESSIHYLIVYIYIYITVSGSLKPTKVPRRQEDQ